MTAKTGFPPRPVLTASERLANETKIANDRPAFWQRYWRGVLRPRKPQPGLLNAHMLVFGASLTDKP